MVSAAPVIDKKILKARDVRHQAGFFQITIFCLVLLYAPILILMIFGFNGGDIASRWDGFSTKWFAVAIQNEKFIEAAKNSLFISSIATVVSTLVAALAALGLTRVRAWPGDTSARLLIDLPLMVPEIVTAVATMSFFALLSKMTNLNFGIGQIVLAHCVFCIPFAFMPIRARLESMDMSLEQAAADLYATPVQAFWKVTMPLLLPGIASGAALAFIVSFDDFTITQLVAGPGQTTLPLFIWNQTRKPMTPEVNAFSAILLTVSIAVIVISFLIAQSRQKTTAA